MEAKCIVFLSHFKEGIRHGLEADDKYLKKGRHNSE
ncbi:protein of unknown function [Maridesulfovibrio hydrothermalis AM13 = DSM 14728]|uniref:Uncharacterized protein n=1 Tax=Maridesulfovibrio hydrothermalis AM13 = DSM 14728 TaxID=1121451 RepID=L0RE23_9BACT|nr:protein of unknown function [Maridesulfovibrio hydrothermalis AM13 = DSM 14728]